MPNLILTFDQERKVALTAIEETAMEIATHFHEAIPPGWRPFREFKWRLPQHLLRDIERLLANPTTPIELRFMNETEMRDCGFTSLEDAVLKQVELNHAWAGQLRMSTQRLCASPHWGFLLQLVRD